MRFISALVAGALATIAAAQTGTSANPFTNSDYSGITAGTPITITWTPTTEGTVSIFLVQGDPNNLTNVETIESSVDNSGSFDWTPDASIVKGSDYALKIVDDADPTQFNFTPLFSIDSDVTSSSVVPSATTSSDAQSTTDEPTTTTDTTAETTSTDANTTSTENTTMATSTSSSASQTTAMSASSSGAAVATGAPKVGAGLVGFIGAAMMLL